MQKYNIAQCTSEAHMEWQNEAERAIQEVKKTVNLIMDHTGCPNFSLGSVFSLCGVFIESLGPTHFTVENTHD